MKTTFRTIARTALVAITMASAGCAGTNPNVATKIVEDAGYTDVQMNDYVAVTLTEKGADVLNSKRWCDGGYNDGDTYIAQFHALFYDFGDAWKIGLLPFKNIRPAICVTAQSRKV